MIDKEENRIIKSGIRIKGRHYKTLRRFLKRQNKTTPCCVKFKQRWFWFNADLKVWQIKT